VFDAPDLVEKPTGVIKRMPVDAAFLKSRVHVLSVERKPLETDLSEARIVVAVGRGIRSKVDLDLAEEMAGIIGARLACTRPLVENGWFNSKQQIGLSGRTVNADLIITLGISGSVQFAAGMRGSKCIMAVNNDAHAGIFDIAHYGFVGDLYEVLPALISLVQVREKV
jgi:electron transfer flavoprotein alpha subunit